MRPNASVKLPEAETHGGVDCGNDCLTREVDGASHSWRNEGDRWDAPLGGDGARSSEARLDLLLASAVRPVLAAVRPAGAPPGSSASAGTPSRSGLVNDSR